MINNDTFRELALLLPNSAEQPHFERTSFRVNQRIFATLDENNCIACLRLSPVDQSVFSDIGRAAIYPVPNKWGQEGWTFFELKKMRKNILLDALTTAYFRAVTKK